MGLDLGQYATNRTLQAREFFSEKQLQRSLRFPPSAEQVDWALVIDGDFMIEADLSVGDFLQRQTGIAPNLGVDSPDEEVVTHLHAWWISDATIHRSFVPNVDGTLGLDLDVDGYSIIVGSFLPKDPLIATELTLSVPTGTDLLYDIGDGVALNLPAFGAPSKALTDFARDEDGRWQLLEDEAILDDELPADIGRRLNQTSWRVPPDLHWQLQLQNEDPNQRLDSTVPLPRSPAEWTWDATNRLAVDVTTVNDVKRAEREGKLFFAGVIIGVAGGFLVLIVELIRESLRHA